MFSFYFSYKFVLFFYLYFLISLFLLIRCQIGSVSCCYAQMCYFLLWSQTSCLIYIECIHGFHFSFLLSQMTHCIFVTTVLLRLDLYYWSLHRSALLYLSNYPADARLLYWHIFFNEIYPAQISKCRMFPVSRKYFSVFIFPKVTLC